MTAISKNLTIVLFAIFFSLARTVYAVDYFSTGFESGTMPKYFPDVEAGDIWTLPPSFPLNYGLGNHFEVTNASSHSGLYSFRITYEGRNGFCNTCGTYDVVHKQGLDGVSYFVADTGENLTLNENDATIKLNDGPAAQPGRIIFNKTNGWSQWEITSVTNETATNDKLLVTLLKSGIGSETPEFNGNDSIAIARQCGLDGHVGGNISRRSDCDGLISWFSYVGAQQPGQSIFRRSYIKQEITSSKIHQKLHYLRPDRGGENAGSIVIFGDSIPPATSIEPVITGLAQYGGEVIYKPGLNNGLDGLEFERSIWYYIEEQYLAESALGASDGAYRLWLSKAGDEDTIGATPVIELTGITLPPVVGGIGTHISFWGNIQHWEHSRGSWYIDDVKISDAKIGKATVNISTNISPPTFPATN